VADLRVGSECVIRSLYDDEKYTNVVAIQVRFGHFWFCVSTFSRPSS
jgi:hypothetical protein